MTAQKTNSIIETLCRTRVKIERSGTTIVNLNLLFSLIALLTAPWLVVGGVIVALALGYKVDVARSDAQEATFNGSSQP